MWFTSMRGNIPINGPILVQKAHEFSKVFNYNDFVASNRWLRDWKEMSIIFPLSFNL